MRCVLNEWRLTLAFRLTHRTKEATEGMKKKKTQQYIHKYV